MDIEELVMLKKDINGLSIKIKSDIFMSVLRQYNKLNELLIDLMADGEVGNYINKRSDINE